MQLVISTLQITVGYRLCGVNSRLTLGDRKNEVESTRSACEKVNLLLAQGRWFSPGTPASSTNKTGRHDITEILLKVALKHQSINQCNKLYY